MAIVAIIATGNMRCVFTGRRNTIMAGAAGAQYLRVVDCCGRRKGYCAVAVLTDVCCLYVCRTLARGTGAIVAADAIAQNV